MIGCLSPFCLVLFLEFWSVLSFGPCFFVSSFWQPASVCLVKETDMQVQEAQRIPNKMDAQKPTARHIIITMPKVKDKERILKAAREKQLVTYRGVPIRPSADFSKETLQARRDWQEVFKVMKSRDLQPRFLYPAKLSLRIKGKLKSFPDKEKLKEFIITKPLLCEMLKGFI